MLYRMLLTLNLCLLLASCSSTYIKDSAALDVHLANIHSYKLDKGFLSFTTVSYGCTFINSFTVEVSDREKNTIKVLRKVSDTCRMKPRLMELQFSIRHLDVDWKGDVKLANKIGPLASYRLSSN